jgi:hypothetical protein
MHCRAGRQLFKMRIVAIDGEKSEIDDQATQTRRPGRAVAALSWL